MNQNKNKMKRIKR